MPLVIKKLSTSPMRLKFVPLVAAAGFTVKLPLTACENTPEKQSRLISKMSVCLERYFLKTPFVGKAAVNFFANKKPVNAAIIMVK